MVLIDQVLIFVSGPYFQRELFLCLSIFFEKQDLHFESVILETPHKIQGLKLQKGNRILAILGRRP